MTNIKLNQSVYYANKPIFTKLLKKFKLRWGKKVINNIIIDGWFNSTSEYVQKLPEEGEYKRFYIVGCQEIAEYLLSLSAIVPQPRTFITLLTSAPWDFGRSYEYKKKTLLDAWDPTFKVRWA